jgi:hypothetical protein
LEVQNYEQNHIIFCRKYRGNRVGRLRIETTGRSASVNTGCGTSINPSLGARSF